jgi:hypothetical protein
MLDALARLFRNAPDPAPRSTARRLGWFVLLWGASVAALGLVAYAIKLALGA